MVKKLTKKEQEARRKEFEQYQEAARLRAVENFRSRIGNLCAVGLFSEREAERLVRRKDEAMQGFFKPKQEFQEMMCNFIENDLLGIIAKVESCASFYLGQGQTVDPVMISVQLNRRGRHNWWRNLDMLFRTMKGLKRKTIILEDRIRWDLRFVGELAFRALDYVFPCEEIFDAQNALSDLSFAMREDRGEIGEKEIDRSDVYECHKAFLAAADRLARRFYLREAELKLAAKKLKMRASQEPMENLTPETVGRLVAAGITSAVATPKPKCEVTLEMAASLCGVSVTTIRNWENGERPEWAKDYPGRGDRKLLVTWATGFKSKKRFNAIARKSPLGLTRPDMVRQQ